MKDWCLDSDPTVIYGLTEGRPLGHGLRASELANPRPLQTYLSTACPPTAIANPGRAALAAVLDPAAGPTNSISSPTGKADMSSPHVWTTI